MVGVLENLNIYIYILYIYVLYVYMYIYVYIYVICNIYVIMRDAWFIQQRVRSIEGSTHVRLYYCR